MARAGAGASGGRINRRFLMLALVSAALSAALVYVALNKDGGGGEGETSAAKVEAIVAAADIPARTLITADMLELKSIPADAKMEAGYDNIDDVVGEVTRFPIVADEQVTSAKIVSLQGQQMIDALAFVIPDGMRAISIKADQVLSAGGLVLPGDYVDILAVFSVSDEKGEDHESYLVRTILQNVEVLAVAQTIADVPPEEEEETNGAEEASSTGEQRARASEAEPNPEATTLTLLVTPEQAEWLFLAEANGTLRAIVRGFGDSETPEVRPITEPELLPGDFVPPAPRQE
jgi:pilus assembly protein CpaB